MKYKHLSQKQLDEKLQECNKELDTLFLKLEELDTLKGDIQSEQDYRTGRLVRDRVVGSIFMAKGASIDGVKLKVVKAYNNCEGCFFARPNACLAKAKDKLGKCDRHYRENDEGIIFIEVPNE